jgi:hypothetical protein
MPIQSLFDKACRDPSPAEVLPEPGHCLVGLIQRQVSMPGIRKGVMPGAAADPSKMRRCGCAIAGRIFGYLQMRKPEACRPSQCSRLKLVRDLRAPFLRDLSLSAEPSVN